MIRGFTAFFRALPMVFDDRRLLTLSALPALFTLIGSFAAGFAMIVWGNRLVEHWHVGFGATLALVLLILAAVVAVWLTALLVGLIATAPFADAISERAETLAGTAPPPKRPFSYVFVGLFHTLALIALYLCIAIPLFFVSSLVPVLSPVTAIVGFVTTALFFAWDAFDPALSRRGRSLSEKWRFFTEHLQEMLGLGVAATLATVIPWAGVLVPPLAIAAAARLYHELEP